MNQGKQHVIRLFREYTGSEPDTVRLLDGSGSQRQYHRLESQGRSIIGVYHEELKENRAFLSFTRSFLRQGLPVPDIYAESSDGLSYLLCDLGDTTLFRLLSETRAKSLPGEFPEALLSCYRKVIGWLPGFQIRGNPDYTQCYPRAAFDEQSILWDLNYFKYYYLKLAGLPFDEQLLETDFRHLAAFLLETPPDFFMYRDFQSRNIMLVNNEPWFIDYQGGRRGALQYDIASLLYDAKADLPQHVRDTLLDHYLVCLEKEQAIDRGHFLKYYPVFVLIRILQALGAYGFRGYYQKKEHFLQSIPYALHNLQALLRKPFPVKLPVLQRTLEMACDQTIFTAGPVAQPSPSSTPEPSNLLTVKITSFSFMRGIPEDHSGHGGGFVFDCRALPNPGRFDHYRYSTGMDQSVIDFLMEEDDVKTFLKEVFTLVDQSVHRYLQRKFNHLMVNFGCTGGQHRSVFCAEALARHLAARPGVRVELFHRELNRLK